MKKMLSIFLVFLLVIGTLPAIPATAADENLEYYTYEITDGEATITEVNASISGDVVIPDQFEGCPVTAIGTEAFAFCQFLTGITIPNSVETIEEAAFYECVGLTGVNIPEGVVSIGKGAFYKCSALKSIVLPDSVTEIGDYLFAWCGELSSVILSKNITAIKEYTFYGCTSLTEIVIPDGVSGIDKAAFYECAGLKSVVIGGSVVEIGDYAFAKCSSITAVEIPESVEKIGEYAFSWCTALTGIAVPDGVVAIGDFSFGGCISLHGVTIGNGVTTIGEGTFYGCNSLVEVVLGDNVAVINNHAFADCSNLAKIIIPVSVIGIGVQAFDGCTSLHSVRYYGAEEQWHNIIIKESNECLLNANIVFNFEPIVNGCVEYWRLILQDAIGISFQMEFTEKIQADPDAYVELTIAGETNRVPVSEAGESLCVNVAAAQMTDDISVCVISGEGIRGELCTYSVKAYADQILEGHYDNATKNLVKALLSYGAMTQKYFGYRLDALADANVSFVLSDVPAAEEKDCFVSAKTEGISFYGASLFYNSKLSMRFYFETEDINRYTFTVEGKQLTPVEKSGKYYVQIDGILPQNLDKVVILSVQDNQGTNANVTYNALDYVIRMFHKGDATLEAMNMLGALYTYHLTAKSYMA